VKPVLVSQPVVTQAVAAVVLEEAMDPVQGLAVAGAAPLLKAAVVITAATMAAAHAHPILDNPGRTMVMAQVTAQVVTPEMAAHHAGSVISQARAHHATILTIASHASRVMKYSARTHAAHALTWASSATILTIASPPAMCQQAFHHQVCRHAVVVVAGVAIAAGGAVAVTSAEAGRARAVVVAVTRAVDFGADSAVLKILIKSSFRLLFFIFTYHLDR